MKSAKVIAVFVVVCAVGFGAYYFWTHQRPTAFERMEKLGKDRENYKSHVAKSEVGQAIEKRDWDFIRKRVVEPNTERERTDFFEQTIQVLDHEPGILSDEKSNNYIYSLVIRFVSSNQKNINPQNAKSVTLATRVLSKLQTPSKGSENYEMTVKLLQNSMKSPVLDELILDVVSRWTPFPEELPSVIRRKLTSQDPGSVQVTLQMLQSINDPELKKTVLGELYRIFSKLHEGNKPLAFKILVLNKDIIQVNLNPLIEYAKSQKSEVWDDAFVFAVERSTNKENYVQDLRSIYQNSSDPIIRRRVSSIIGGE